MSFERSNPDVPKIVGGIKGNILLIGPTGVGKTYIIKLIADKLGVPFVKGDATKFTETGYVGGDVEDLIRDLVSEADGDISLAEYGIIYLDEIDKVASSTNSYGPDVSRTGVQRNLLKIMEDSDVDLKNPMDMASQMEAVMQAQQTGKVERKKINTRNILFVMSGAFQGLSEIIRKRLNTQPLGFTASDRPDKHDDTQWFRKVARQDLIEFGFESEFVGRLPVVAVLDELDVDGLYQILKNPKSSVILGKKRDFEAYGLSIDFDDKALQIMAEAAAKEKTGARGLLSIVEQTLMKFEKYLPSSSIKSLSVTEELVRDPDTVLDRLLVNDATTQISTEFEKDHGITLHFTADALELIRVKSKKQNDSPYSFCHKILKNYEYGLKLLGKSSFEVTHEVLDNYEEYLNNLIKTTYHNKPGQSKA
ncbi:MAG: AAA family ATPase [Spirochaetota bacterium]|nr:AAA family ATPase [Spirochaetota bacterium]